MGISYEVSPSCGNSSITEGLIGMVDGLLGMFGLNGLLPSSGVAKEELLKAQQAMEKAQTEWAAIIQDVKFKIIQDQLSYLQELMNFSNLQVNVMFETVNEKIATNSLMITMLVILVVFLILYDIVEVKT